MAQKFGKIKPQPGRGKDKGVRDLPPSGLPQLAPEIERQRQAYTRLSERERRLTQQRMAGSGRTPYQSNLDRSGIGQPPVPVIGQPPTPQIQNRVSIRGGQPTTQLPLQGRGAPGGRQRQPATTTPFNLPLGGTFGAGGIYTGNPYSFQNSPGMTASKNVRRMVPPNEDRQLRPDAATLRYQGLADQYTPNVSRLGPDANDKRTPSGWSSTVIGTNPDGTPVYQRDLANAARYSGLAIESYINTGNREQLPRILSDRLVDELPFPTMAGLSSRDWLSQMGYVEYEPGKWRIQDPRQFSTLLPGGDYGNNWEDWGKSPWQDWGGGWGGGGWQDWGNNTYTPKLGLVNWRIGI